MKTQNKRLLDVFEIGTQVDLRHTSGDSLTVLIIAIGIYKTGVKYQVTWMNGKVRQEVWVYDYELNSRESTDYQQIGFCSGEPKEYENSKQNTD